MATLADLLYVEKCRCCFETVYPGGPASSICPHCWLKIAEMSPQIESTSEHLLYVASAMQYRGRVKKLLYRFKYDDDRLIGRDLSKLIANTLEILLSELGDPPRESVILVPVPLHFWRLIKRGFNQSELLAQWIGKELDLPVRSAALKRCKSTRAHHGLGRADRLANISGAFKAGGNLVQGRTVILVDDIYTSGATLDECARTLMAGGCARVAAITAARAMFEDEDAPDDKNIKDG